MTSGQERRKHARSQQPVGYVSRHAQQRVQERVMEIMSRRDAAVRENSPSDSGAGGGAAGRDRVTSRS
jgi:hypothetical protein